MNNKRSRDNDSDELTSRPVAIKASNLEKLKISEALKWNDNECEKFEKAVEQERKTHDLLWKLFDGKEKEAMRNHLDGIITHVKDTYGEDLQGLVADLTYSRQDTAQTSKTEKIKRYTKGEDFGRTDVNRHQATRLQYLKIMEWMRDSDDTNLHHALWFASLIIFPAIKEYVLSQPLVKREGCKHWIEHRIAPSINDLLGPFSEGLTLAGWVRDLRAEYVTLCGFSFPKFQETSTKK